MYIMYTVYISVLKWKHSLIILRPSFLRFSCSVEETYAKLLAKLAKMCTNSGTNG